MNGQVTVREAFAVQAQACEKLGSPFMARLCRLFHDRLGGDTPAGRKVLGWRGDPSPLKDSVPLRLAGALHALVLSGRSGELASTYPPHDVCDDALWASVDAALEAHSDFICKWMDSPPQTNEVRRSSALFAGLCVVAQIAGDMPLTLLEPGASAGLNLACDAYGHRFGGEPYGKRSCALVMEPEWRGARPPHASPTVAQRQGCDINPLDIHQAHDRLRMRSYVWPDQPDRLLRLDKAIDIALGGSAPFSLERANAETWLKRLLQAEEPQGARVVMHSIAWQYFPPDTRRACESIIERAGAIATRDAPLFRLSMEADDTGEWGAGLTLYSWPGANRDVLGRVDFHGRWIEWHGGGGQAAA